MEYIQCTYCHKKYRVNEQVRAAAGRMVRCKDCGEKIEIVILQDKDKSPPPAVDSQPQEENTVESESNQQKLEKADDVETHRHEIQETKPDLDEQKHQHDSEKNNHAKKITLSAVLGVLIVGGSMYGFFQGRSQQADDLHQTKKPQSVSPSINREHFSKRLISSEKKADLTDLGNQGKEHVNSHSAACKEASAQQWLTDFTMSHGQQKGRDYMLLLDQGIQTSALIRKNCGGSSVVAEVLQSAQKGVPPECQQGHPSH